MTHSSTWKRREQQAARLFNCRRTPLSGGASGHTRSDILSDRVFAEVKLRARSAVHRLYDRTAELARQEGKVPVLALAQKGRPGVLLVLKPKHIHELHHLLKDVDHLPREEPEQCHERVCDISSEEWQCSDCIDCAHRSRTNNHLT